jgi:pimeloyl-ACP methyl ester carboxylesterase
MGGKPHARHAAGPRRAPGHHRAHGRQRADAAEARLRGLAAPTLLLWGEKDRAIPVGHAADYLRELPDARLVALPGIGHVPMEEAPAATVAAIRAFLD